MTLPDHGERDVVDQDGLAGCVGRTAKAPLAVAQADDRDRRRARAIVAANEQTARSGGHRQTLKEVTRHVFPRGELRRALDHHVQISRPVVREEAGQHGF
jgi:hypothetical protein